MMRNTRTLGLLSLATGVLSSVLPFLPSIPSLPYPSYPSDDYPSYPPDYPTCAKPKHCSNVGWDWAEYPNPVTYTGAGYPGFRGDVYKTKAPDHTGVTTVIGGVPSLGGSIYNYSTPVPTTYFALNHHAYLWACEAGDWRFDIGRVDDIVQLWVGDKAYSGWADENTDARVVYNAGSSAGSFVATLRGGGFVPIRVLFANAQGGGAFQLNVTSPGGTVVHQTGRNTENDYFVRYSCHGEPHAPEFAPFGQEA
ncbi:putative conidiospore surface [Rosellinia necatrix]|uniref:Putative conidiospore surface n=1 Tax=Rosellinia necatrix TaxID=77044 RepID=A0A1S7ULK9_ROSNE|nr:putative conidiospore surface [Rosellinia necatrix]